MTSGRIDQPQPPSPGWNVPSGPARPPRTSLGLPLSVWVCAWLPIVPTAVLAIIVPGFVSPLVDARASLAGLPPIAILLLLPLINLAVAGATRNEAATWVTIAVTSFLGMVFSILGPAMVLILVNLST